MGMSFIYKLLGGRVFDRIGSYDMTEPVIWDLSAVPVLMVASMVVERIVLKIGRKVGLYLILRNKGQKFHEENPFRVENFTHRSAFLVTHIFLTILAYFLFRQDFWWFWNCHVLGSVFPQHKKYSWQVYLYYNLNLADYLYKTLALVLSAVVLGKKRKDFWEMIYHHVLSAVLLIYSLLTGYAEFGILFLYISNLTDVFTYSGRMCNDVKWKGPSYVMLPLLILVWIINRLYINPVFLIAPGFIGYQYKIWDSASRHTIHGIILIKLLCGLYILHVYWIYGLSRIAYRTITKGTDAVVDVLEIDVPPEEKDSHV